MSRVCSHCGAPLKRKASFCRECGSDLDTGWSPLAQSGGLPGLPTFAEDEYEAFLAREFGKRGRGARLRRVLGKALVILALAGFLVWVFS